MKSLYKNKKANVKPRDIIVMILVFSGVIAFASILVTQMGTEYENTEMVSSYNQDDIGSSTLTEKAETWEEIGHKLDGNLASLLLGGLEAIKVVLSEVIRAPITFSEMITSPIELLGVEQTEDGTGAISIIQILIAAVLYALIIFGIIKVFLKGGEI